MTGIGGRRERAHPAPSGWRRLASSVTGLAVAAIVFAALVTAGQGYFWCRPMQSVMVRDCCVHADAPEGAGPEFTRGSCCDARSFEALPPSQVRDEGVSPAASDVAPAAVLVEVPRVASPAPAQIAPALAAPRQHRERGPPTALERCVEMQIFLC